MRLTIPHFLNSLFIHNLSNNFSPCNNIPRHRALPSFAYPFCSKADQQLPATTSSNALEATIKNPETIANSNENALTNNKKMEELIEANELLKRLCLRGHMETAGELVSTCLVVGMPYEGIDLSLFVGKMRRQRKKTVTNFLCRIKNGNYEGAESVCRNVYKRLIEEYSKHFQLVRARFLLRTMPGCNETVYANVIEYCCKAGNLYLALQIVCWMLSRTSLVPGPGIRVVLFKSLLRDARIKEAYRLHDCFEILDKCGISYRD